MTPLMENPAGELAECCLLYIVSDFLFKATTLIGLGKKIEKKMGKKLKNETVKVFLLDYFFFN